MSPEQVKINDSGLAIWSGVGVSKRLDSLYKVQSMKTRYRKKVLTWHL